MLKTGGFFPSSLYRGCHPARVPVPTNNLQGALLGGGMLIKLHPSFRRQKLWMRQLCLTGGGGGMHYNRSIRKMCSFSAKFAAFTFPVSTCHSGPLPHTQCWDKEWETCDFFTYLCREAKGGIVDWTANWQSGNLFCMKTSASHSEQAYAWRPVQCKAFSFYLSMIKLLHHQFQNFRTCMLGSYWKDETLWLKLESWQSKFKMNNIA